jgi:glucose-6-phosphate isomerase
MSLTLNLTNTFSDKIGPHGVTMEEAAGIRSHLRDAMHSVYDRHARGELYYLDLPFDAEAYTACESAARSFAGAENLLVAGIGGSALGPSAIFGALAHPLHNLLPREQRSGKPRLFLLDNVDPDLATAQFELCDPRETVFNIISKSGATAETAAATLLIFDRLKKALGAQWKNHVICTTDPVSGDLRQLCQKEGLPTLDLPSSVGGRFSVLTAVGLFPSFMLGFDVEAMMHGASDMAARCLDEDLDMNPAAQMATLLYLMDTAKHKPMHVMMAYANSLYLLADWFRQLWAESLGKAADVDGVIVNSGPTPIKALGTTDQHSQVQLYIEGPHDKMFIFLEAQEFRKELILPSLYPEVSSLNYLGGQSMNKLMAAEFAATREALAREGRPSMTISFPELNAYAVGEFFMLLEMATTLCGSLYNINPFDQPGVELGKVLTYGLMGRKGFEDKADGI